MGGWEGKLKVEGELEGEVNWSMKEMVKCNSCAPFLFYTGV